MPHSSKFTKRTQRPLTVLAGNAARKYETNPSPGNLRRLDRCFDIWTIFVRAAAAGRMCGSDVMGDIGEIPRRRDVTGRLATYGSSDQGAECRLKAGCGHDCPPHKPE
jgi:hypothetical protein